MYKDYENLRCEWESIWTRLNAAKSFVIFGNQVDHSLKHEIKNVFGILTEGGMGM